VLSSAYAWLEKWNVPAVLAKNVHVNVYELFAASELKLDGLGVLTGVMPAVGTAFSTDGATLTAARFPAFVMFIKTVTMLPTSAVIGPAEIEICRFIPTTPVAHCAVIALFPVVVENAETDAEFTLVAPKENIWALDETPTEIELPFDEFMLPRFHSR